MTPTKTECSAQTYSFGQLERRQVVADFSGGQITSDGGLILVAEINQRSSMGITTMNAMHRCSSSVDDIC